MFTKKWWIATPLAVLLIGTTARGSTIRDEAGMFSPKLVEQATARLDRMEKATKVPVVIETTRLLPELTPDSSREEKHKAINQAAKHRDEQLRDAGIYILISRREHLISQPLVRSRIASIVPMERRDAIRTAFINEFKKGDFDAGLKRGVEAIEQTLGGHRVGGGAEFPRRSVLVRIAAVREEVAACSRHSC